MGTLHIRKRRYSAYGVVTITLLFLSVLAYLMYTNQATISSLKSELANKERIIETKDNLIREQEGTLALQRILMKKQVNYIALQTQKLEEKNNLLIEGTRQVTLLKADLAKLKEVKQKAELQAKLELAKREETKAKTTSVVAKTTVSNSKGKISTGWVITYYSLDYASTGKRPGDKGYGVTSSGTIVKEGRTIACPSQFKAGTRLYIEGVGARVCEDTGSAIKGNKIDVYVANKTTAQLYQPPYGKRKNVKVTILTSN